MVRKIIHIDMDAFFASIEQRDNPQFKGQPVIVGGDPGKRGVVATCSYEARTFGVRSAMPTSKALKLCPMGIFIKPRFAVYQKVSKQIRAIFFQYTDLVEPLSLDEAYLDVTQNKKNEPSATRLAAAIKRQIFSETGLTASAGVSFNKFLAKVASDWNKPNGITVIPPEKAVEFIEKLPIRKFYGVGAVTERKMLQRGIFNGKDLRKLSCEELVDLFGKLGKFFYNLANCQDDRLVNPHRVRKSIGKEETFQEDINDADRIKEIVKKLAYQVSSILESKHICARTITLKIRYRNFKTETRSKTLTTPVQSKEDLFREAAALLQRTKIEKKYVRLLGISTSNLRSSKMSF